MSRKTAIFKRKLYQTIICRVPKTYQRYAKIKQKLFQCNQKIGLNQKKSWFLEKTPEEVIEKLKRYNVISFDVFDTLIFRPYLEASELFEEVGKQVQILEFQKIRCEMEQRAREEQMKKEGNMEVTLDEIYTMIHKKTGIKEEIKEIELSLEYQMCFSNPYFRQVVEGLQKEKKRFIIISDMYLNKKQIRQILKNAGYKEFAAYYISSEYRKSKSSGELYQTVLEKEGANHSFVHIGDNWTADIKQAQIYGIDALYYKK